jgi:hypothetical protein
MASPKNLGYNEAVGQKSIENRRGEKSWESPKCLTLTTSSISATYTISDS